MSEQKRRYEARYDKTEYGYFVLDTKENRYIGGNIFLQARAQEIVNLLNAQAEQIEQLAAALKPFANIYELFVSEVIASGGDPRFLTDFSKWWQQKRDGTDYFLLERAREALAALKVQP